MNFPVYPESAARESVRTLPRLTSDEYLAFVTELLAHADPVKVARQKALEEQITVPFRLVDVPDVRRPVDHDGAE